MKTWRTVVKHGHKIIFYTAEFSTSVKCQIIEIKQDGEHKAGKNNIKNIVVF